MKPAYVMRRIDRKTGLMSVATYDRVTIAELLRAFRAKGVQPLSEGPHAWFIGTPDRRIYLIPLPAWQAEQAEIQAQRDAEREACPWAHALETEQ